jgi:hypothetical protein
MWQILGFIRTLPAANHTLEKITVGGITCCFKNRFTEYLYRILVFFATPNCIFFGFYVHKSFVVFVTNGILSDSPYFRQVIK